MTTKNVLSLLVAIILSAGLALAQQPGSAPNPESEASENVFSLLVSGDGFLGVYAEDISKENMSKYKLSQVRGVGVTEVVKDSPAEKAGLRKDDVILRLDGENVTSVRKLNRLVSEIAPDQTVRMTISRGGSEQELSATIGRRQNTNSFRGLLKDNNGTWEWDAPWMNNENPMVFTFGGGRRIGINTMELTKQLADYFGIAGGKGVLVTSVSEDGPAAKAGVKAGDVITAVDGETVASSGDLSRVINRKKEGNVTLTIVRNKSQQTIQVTPTEGRTPLLGPPQIGRRIVIPRVELGTIPELNIAIPRIELPTIPSMNIELPRVRIPRVRVLRTSGPI